jgi:hypothetical protein
MLGTGKTILQPGSASVIEMGHGIAHIKERTVVNEGTMTLTELGILDEGEGAVFNNLGTFNANSEQEFYTPSIRLAETKSGETPSVFTNRGIFQKTAAVQEAN